MATYVSVRIKSNIAAGSGYASAWGGSVEYKAYFSGTEYTKSKPVFEIGDELTVHANPVSGYKCVTSKLTVNRANHGFTVYYEKAPGNIYVKARDTNGNALSFDCYWIQKEV